MNSHDDASCMLRWDFHKDGNATEPLRLLREHASTLKELHLA